MKQCRECKNVGEIFDLQKDEVGEAVLICLSCGAEDSKLFIDEDYLRERLQDGVEIGWHGPGDDAA